MPTISTGWTTSSRSSREGSAGARGDPRAAAMAPASKATYNFAVRAIEARQPFVAESALRTLSPDVGRDAWMVGVLGRTRHIACTPRASHDEELTAAPSGPTAVSPIAPSAYCLQMRALGALGRLRDIERSWSARRGPLVLHPGRSRGPRAGSCERAGGSLGFGERAGRWFARAYDAYATADTGGTATDGTLGTSQSRRRTRPASGGAATWIRPGARTSAEPEYLGFVGVRGGSTRATSRGRKSGPQLETDTSYLPSAAPSSKLAGSPQRLEILPGEATDGSTWQRAESRVLTIRLSGKRLPRTTSPHDGPGHGRRCNHLP